MPKETLERVRFYCLNNISDTLDLTDPKTISTKETTIISTNGVITGYDSQFFRGGDRGDRR